jgi:hypothetical protein
MLLALPALAQDADGDGVPDANDNCVNVSNAAQVDTNHDGFGNRCDPDYWNDGTVDDIDFEIFSECFGTADPDCDLNGDGVTGAPDFSIFAGFYGGPPGPSGLACAGTIPCADAGIAGDADSDGVADPADNCVNHANPSQLDSNQDGIGNRCDPDYDQDGTVDDVDYAIFAKCFGTAAPDCDLNGDGITGAPDFAIFSSFYGGPPGPAGAGTQDSCPCSVLDGNCP